ncbi:Sensor domain-containing protein OS=Streptomyces tendae OX=1932 GN=GUR47_06800 PE=4 SV=1 [Streptomyces tendae]
MSTEGVPSYDYRHRHFRTDLDTSAVQSTVVAGTAAQAKALAKHYDDLIRTCADRIEETSPDVEAEGRDYGSLPVEEGARVRGLHTETSWGATDIALLSVGRDGRTVTVVKWSQLGDFGDAPVAAFKKTTRTAVDRLY